jgi:hypothetical protein
MGEASVPVSGGRDRAALPTLVKHSCSTFGPIFAGRLQRSRTSNGFIEPGLLEHLCALVRGSLSRYGELPDFEDNAGGGFFERTSDSGIEGARRVPNYFL